MAPLPGEAAGGVTRRSPATGMLPGYSASFATDCAQMKNLLMPTAKNPASGSRASKSGGSWGLTATVPVPFLGPQPSNNGAAATSSPGATATAPVQIPGAVTWPTHARTDVSASRGVLLWCAVRVLCNWAFFFRFGVRGVGLRVFGLAEGLSFGSGIAHDVPPGGFCLLPDDVIPSQATRPQCRTQARLRRASLFPPG
jgi:hypothetical protein